MMDTGPATIPIRPAQPRPSAWSKLGRETRRLGRQLQPAKHWLECRRFCHQLRLMRQWLTTRHEPYRAVFVVTCPRSGSNLLIDYLGQLPGVQSLSEVLNWGLKIGPKKFLHFQRAVRHIQLSMELLKTPLRGCKLFLRELENYRLTINDLEAAFPKARYIVLYRENLAEQYVSQKAAEETQQWILLPGQQRKRTSVTVNPIAFERHCQDARRGFEEILASPAIRERGVVLTYEQLASDPALCLRELICPLLDVPTITPKSNLCKQSVEPLSSRIANYAEVAALVHSPVARLHFAPIRKSLHVRAA